MPWSALNEKNHMMHHFIQQLNSAGKHPPLTNIDHYGTIQHRHRLIAVVMAESYATTPHPDTVRTSR